MKNPFADFDETTYLTANPDVLKAVQEKSFPSGFIHYVQHGYLERRPGASRATQNALATLYDESIPTPTPPPTLRLRVHGDEALSGFTFVGKIVALDIEAALRDESIRLGQASRILDFGCGCARVLVWLQKYHRSSNFHATDIDAEAIAWCREHLSHVATFQSNTDGPPLAFSEGFFDFAYVVSVFTHLPENMQFLWLRELHRITKVGGYVFISVHGEQSFPSAAPISDKEDFAKSGFCYLVGNRTAGLPDYYQQSYHTEDYILARWSSYFEIKRVIKRGINDHQDLVICERV